jgi:hypothetical protein
MMHNAPHQGSQGSLKRMRMSRRSVQKDEEAGQYWLSSEGAGILPTFRASWRILRMLG